MERPTVVGDGINHREPNSVFNGVRRVRVPLDICCVNEDTFVLSVADIKRTSMDEGRRVTVWTLSNESCGADTCDRKSVVMPTSDILD